MFALYSNHAFFSFSGEFEMSSAKKNLFGGCADTTESTVQPKLLRDFTYPFSRVLFVWSPSAQVDPGVVSTILGSYDHYVGINNHWVRSSSSSSLKIWCGAVAKFSHEKIAKIAADGIPEKCG